MPAKPKAPKRPVQVKAADLHLFRALHAELDAAHERVICAAHKMQNVHLRNELEATQLAARHNAAMRDAKTHSTQCADGVAAAKRAAADLAARLSIDYAIDLRTHAIHPLTGDVVAIPEDKHG